MNLAAFILVLTVGTNHGIWVKEMENPSLFEGDMVLTPSQETVIKSGKASYASIKTDHWPHTIPYELAPNIATSSDATKAIEEAIADYHLYTCLRFVKRTNELGYIHFYMGSGCSSPVGYTGSRNSISLGYGCWHKSIVIHEIAHSLGLYHEQSRPDRDNYVEILWQNIQQGMSYNFDKQPASEIDSLGTPYDFSSVMHYDSTAFGAGQQTIRTKDPSKQRLIGQRYGFSEIDKAQINLMYKCSGVNGTDTPTTSPIDTSSPATSGACKDSSDYCPTWASAGYCRSPSYEWYMKDNCKASCNLCSGGVTTVTPTTSPTYTSSPTTSGVCTDSSSHCPAWASVGYCKDPSYEWYMRDNCKASCKLC